MMAIGVAYGLVSDSLRVGPPWLLPSIIVAMLAPLTIARWHGRHLLSRRLGLVLISVAALAVSGSVVALVVRLLGIGGVAPKTLLRDAALLWVSNIAIFAIWYWELDGGGPAVRFHHGYRPTDLLFPQNQQGGEMAREWSPGFVDYLFVAFTASTAFSPTDTLVLLPRTKLLMMLQCLSSIAILAILAARAINTLQ